MRIPVRDKTGVRLREGEARQLAEKLVASDLILTAAFAELIDPSGDRAATFAQEFLSRSRRRPTMRELVEGLVANVAAPKEAEREKAALEAKLAQEPPLDPLDEMDPDVDVVEPPAGT